MLPRIVPSRASGLYKDRAWCLTAGVPSATTRHIAAAESKADSRDIISDASGNTESDSESVGDDSDQLFELSNAIEYDDEVKKYLQLK